MKKREREYITTGDWKAESSERKHNYGLVFGMCVCVCVYPLQLFSKSEHLKMEGEKSKRTVCQYWNSFPIMISPLELNTIK